MTRAPAPFPRVSAHAMARFAERSIGCNLNLPDDTPALEKVAAYCEHLDMSIDELRAAVLTPPIEKMIRGGFQRFTIGGLRYIVEETGLIVTVVKEGQRSNGKLLSGKLRRPDRLSFQRELNRRKCRNRKHDIEDV